MKKQIKKLLTILLITISIVAFLSCENNNYAVNENINKNDHHILLKEFEKTIKAQFPTLMKIREFPLKNNNLNQMNKSELSYSARHALAPIVDSTIKLLSSFDISNEDITKNFGSLNNPAIAIAGIALYAKLSHYDEINNSLVLSKRPAWFTCALEALGVGALYDWIVIQEGLGRAAILTMFKKVASKYLGYIGVALAVADFAYCMWG